MKRVEHVIPFIDIVFQTLGVLIVVMATLENVESIPVNLATVGKEVAVTKRMRDCIFVAVSKEGLFSGKKKVSREELGEIVAGKEVILRIDKDIRYGRVVEVTSGIQSRAKAVSLEVKRL